jgi:hypothetical protein
VFSKTEDWTYFEGFYFCFVFSSTIGYVSNPHMNVCLTVGRSCSYIGCGSRLIHFVFFVNDSCLDPVNRTRLRGIFPSNQKHDGG